VCFLALVLEMALRRKIKALGKEWSSGTTTFSSTCVNSRRSRSASMASAYLARTQLTGQAGLAFKALGMRPPLHVQEVPRPTADREHVCCGT